MAGKFETHRFTVEENGRQVQVVIPKSDDKSYDNYLIEAQKEKTRDQLRKKAPPETPKEKSRESLAGLLKERQEYDRRRAEGSKRYF